MFLVSVRLDTRRERGQSYAAPIPQVLRGRWCNLIVALPAHAEAMVVRIQAVGDDDERGDDVYLQSPPARRNGRAYIIAYVPAFAHSLKLECFTLSPLPELVPVRARVVPRTVAALLIGLSRPRQLIGTLRGSPVGLLGRLRAILAIMATGVPPCSYSLWTALFDTWENADYARLLASPRRAGWPSIAVFICCAESLDLTVSASQSANLQATLASLDTQILPPQRILCRNDLVTAVAETDAEYIALLQAGEVLPRHGLAVMADKTVELGYPDATFADEDVLTADGRRRNPQFKPEPNYVLMLSGTLSRGVWLLRRKLLMDCTGIDTRWAESLRLVIWLRLYEQGKDRTTRRIPFVLTHRRPETEAAPPTVLTSVVASHLRRASIPARIQEDWPLRVQFAAPSPPPKVAIVVPSACRAPHVLRCMTALLERTAYANFELLVAISQQGPLDATQQTMLDRLGVNPHVRHMLIRTERFNFSVANNRAVAATTCALVLLLNDDIEPLDVDWLTHMVAHMADPHVGVVGAKLLYPNLLVQHGGIIIGAAGLCDHANRFLPDAAPGYAWRSSLDQEVSAVTGACLLVRRSLYDALGGLDESYASAFNDVDFCLRARERGYAVAVSAAARMIHYESLSFGRHYSREETERQGQDSKRFRARWGAHCIADPFHSPNLSLQRGNAWGLAFPPRIRRPPA